MVKESYMSEEFFQFIESPETATIRLNTDAMSHLGTLFNSVNDTVMQQAVFDMLCKHSKFVLETSEKVILNKRLGIKAVK
tara:strand:+ start:286 stop:525 length:240 start_codon:yes stop_codon:yes gene_type:complete